MACPALFGRKRPWKEIFLFTTACGIAVAPVLMLYPRFLPLGSFLVFTVWVNGPVSFLFPGAYEPALMLMGTLFHPVLVAAVGVSGTLVVEAFNYCFYGKVMGSTRLSSVATNRWVITTVVLFNKSPFLAIFLCGLVLPYWPIRFLSPLARYPIGYHLLATFLGRFPRLLFFTTIAAYWSIDRRLLAAVVAASFLVAAVVWFRKKPALQPLSTGEAE